MRITEGVFDAADASPGLYGYFKCGNNALNYWPVHRFAVTGAVKVDHMQPRRTQALPFQRRRDGIGVINTLASVVALRQLNALSAANIDRGDDLHYLALTPRAFSRKFA